MFNRKKIVVLIASAMSLTLTACGGSGSGGSTGSNDLSDETVTGVKSGTVTISKVPTIPTNGGLIQPHMLQVDNNTGKNLVFVSSRVIGNVQPSLLDRARDTLSRSLGGTGYNRNVSVDNCGKLAADRTCGVIVTPEAPDGSTVVQLTFKDADGEIYQAAQVVNYSSHVTSHHGFIVNSDNLTEFHSSKDYSFTVPFIADDDYESIKVKSDILAINRGFDCAGKVSKGTHCTATFTMPVAPKEGYVNDIHIIGKKSNGTINQYTINSKAFFDDRPSLALTQGPVSIIASNTVPAQNIGELVIVNTGSLAVSGISDTHKPISVEIDGTVQQVANSPLVTLSSALKRSFNNLLANPQTLDCQFAGATPDEIGHTAQTGSLCTVRFQMQAESMNQNGHDQYTVTYNGEAGPSTTKSTTVYYRGLSNDNPGCPDCLRPYEYSVTGPDFTGTKTNRVAVKSVVIRNVGTQSLYNLNFALNNPNNVPIQIIRNDCAPAGSAATLAPKASCAIELQYSPVVDTTLNSLIGTVTAQDVAGNSSFNGATKTVAITYSAEPDPVVAPGLIFSSTGDKIELATGESRVVTKRLIVSANNSPQGGVTVTGVRKAVQTSALSPNLALALPAQINDATSNGNVVNKFAREFNFGALGSANHLSTNPGEQVTLSGTDVGVIDYLYGNPNGVRVESGLLEHVFSIASNPNPHKYTLGYETSDDVAGVTNPTTTTIDTNGRPLVSGESFVLVKSNKLVLRARYTAPDNKNLRILVDDSDLDFGFFPVRFNQAGQIPRCAQTSLGDSVPTLLAAKQSCVVEYTFLADQIAGANNYTLATQQRLMHTFENPSYLSFDISNGTKVKRVKPAGEFKFIPLPFADVQPTVTQVAPNLYTVRFNVTDNFSAIAPALNMQNAGIMIEPNQNANADISSSSSCQIAGPIAPSPAGAATCTINFTLRDPATGSGAAPLNRRLNFKTSSTTDGGYNAKLGFISLQ